jgi:hypothetical protein
MSYDRIRIRTNQCPGGWLERNQAAKMSLSEQFELTFARLCTQGNFVVLVAGQNLASDELFLFEEVSDAQEFYDSGFMKWESFTGHDEEGCGFQEVSLHRDGRLVATKSCPPSMHLEVQHE